jgi:hypothetical protein
MLNRGEVHIFAHGDEPTNIGFGFLPEEYNQYMSLKNAKLLYQK